MPYLNETGLTTLWNKIKANFAGVDDLSITHGASDATITDTLKTPGSGATLSTDSITINAATTSTAGLMSSADKTILDGLKTTVDGLTASGGEPNQNAFSNVKVGSTTVQADSKTDTLELVASTNITLTPDATNDKVTVAHSTPTGAAAKTSGLYKITTDSQGHVTGATAVTKSDITGLGIPGSDTNTDTKVKQNQMTSNNGYLPILTAASANATTGETYFSNNTTLGNNGTIVISNNDADYVTEISYNKIVWEDVDGNLGELTATDYSGKAATAGAADTANAVAWANVSGKPSSFTAASHTHGNITNAGALQSTGVAVANNDCLVVTDASNSAKVAKTTTVFDGSTTTKALTPKGTFETFLQSHQSLSGYATESYVTTAISNAQVGAAMFQGTVAANTTISGAAYKKGWYWVVSTAGTYVGETCEIGDMIFCVNDKGSAYAASDFKVLQTNITAIPDTTINALS